LLIYLQTIYESVSIYQQKRVNDVNFKAVSEIFNVVAICNSENYTQIWIMKLHNY